MKILLDMNLSPKWIDFLNANNIESLHWSYIGPPDSPDTEIINYAKNHNFTILTNDLDFGFILAITQGKKPSIIQIRTGILSPEIIGNIVVNAINHLASDIAQGAMITVDQRKIRVTVLPL